MLVAVEPRDVKTATDGNTGLVKVQLVKDRVLTRRLKHDEAAEAVSKCGTGLCRHRDRNKVCALVIDAVSRSLGAAGRPAASIHDVDCEVPGERLRERHVGRGAAESAAHEDESVSLAD